MLHKLFMVAFWLVFASAAMAQTGPVEVTDAWARATPGKAENGAAYLTLRAPTADRLTGLSTPVADKAELHTMTMQGNVMQMRPLTELDLPASRPVTLKPGGIHIMLLGLKQPLHQGQSFPLTLHFEKGGTREVTVAVEAIGARGPRHESGGGAPMTMPIPAGH